LQSAKFFVVGIRQKERKIFKDDPVINVHYFTERQPIFSCTATIYCSKGM